MERLKMHSHDFTQENIIKIAAIFPRCVTEVMNENGVLKKAIDFDLLRQELSEHVVDGPRERYHLNWPGKQEALIAANTPVSKTLRPLREESVDFETSKNIFIDGENLDALKLLQETYLNSIDIIFIDPPYNTGNDFLYEDNFLSNIDNYKRDSGQLSEHGHKMVLNLESNGRFHSKWLSLMFPRLRLAWNLLCDDGIIAVTIDNREVCQLGKLLDEVFGPEGRLACAPWLSEASGGKEKTGLRSGHEYVLLYSKKNATALTQESRSTGELNLNDVNGPYRKGRELMKWGGTSLRSDRPKQFYPLTTPSGERVLPHRNDGREGHWRWGCENPKIIDAQQNPDYFHWERRPFDEGITVEGERDRWVPYEKVREEEKFVGWSTWLDKLGTNADATRELKELFGVKPFDTPKPTGLIQWVISLHGNMNATVLDFFAGSASTGHAVLKQNAVDGGERRFILVQLPEECPADSEASKLGMKTICDIGKERIRRAGVQLKESCGFFDHGFDTGFRVLKIDTSNMKDVYYRPDTLKKDDLFDHIENIKVDRTPEDLLFQVLLDWGVDLSLPIAREEIDGKTIFFVDDNALAACFDTGVTEELVKKLAIRKPLRVVFRDAGFSDDSVKINVEQIFKLMSPDTEVKAI